MRKIDLVSSVKTRGQNRALLLLSLAIIFGVTSTKTLIAQNLNDAQAKREMWSDRLLELSERISSDDYQWVTMGLLGAGQIQKAKTFIQEKLPESQRRGAIRLMADMQSSQGDVPGALQTLESLPKGSAAREYAQSLVAIRQAQHGNITESQKLIEDIKDQDSLDRARNAISKAQALAGDLKAAQGTIELIQDEYQRREAQKTIILSKTGILVSPKDIPSPFLASYISSLCQFSNDSSWKYRAMLTLAAAYRKDEKTLDSQAVKTIVKLKELPIGLERATGYAILAVAYAEAGKAAEAEYAGDEAAKAMSGDIVGISRLMGNPILIYAMIQLGRYEHIEKTIKAAEKDQEKMEQMYSSSDLMAVGAALAEKKEDQQLEKIYQQLKKPINRVYFALGVIQGLDRFPKPSQKK